MEKRLGIKKVAARAVRKSAASKSPAARLVADSESLASDLLQLSGLRPKWDEPMRVRSAARRLEQNQSDEGWRQCVAIFGLETALEAKRSLDPVAANHSGTIQERSDAPGPEELLSNRFIAVSDRTHHRDGDKSSRRGAATRRQIIWHEGFVPFSHAVTARIGSSSRAPGRSEPIQAPTSVFRLRWEEGGQEFSLYEFQDSIALQCTSAALLLNATAIDWAEHRYMLGPINESGSRQVIGLSTIHAWDLLAQAEYSAQEGLAPWLIL